MPQLLLKSKNILVCLWLCRRGGEREVFRNLPEDRKTCSSTAPSLLTPHRANRKNMSCGRKGVIIRESCFQRAPRRRRRGGNKEKRRGEERWDGREQGWMKGGHKRKQYRGERKWGEKFLKKENWKKRGGEKWRGGLLELNGDKEEKGKGKQGKGGVRKMEKKSVDFCKEESRRGRLQERKKIQSR